MEPEVLGPGFDPCCGSDVEVVGSAHSSERKSITVELGRCRNCEEIQWTVRLRPGIPWIGAVERQVFELRARLLEQHF